jgi:hypothetical protein
MIWDNWRDFKVFRIIWDSIGDSRIFNDFVGIHRTIQAGRICFTFLTAAFVISNIFMALGSNQVCPKFLQVFLGDCM